MVLFHLKSTEDLIVINGLVTTLGKAYYEKLKTDMHAKIAYHTAVERKPDESNQSVLEIKQTHRIGFLVPENTQEAVKNANTFAAHLPLQQWNTQQTALLWQAKWTAKGLTPIKPAVYSLVEMELLPGRCVILTT